MKLRMENSGNHTSHQMYYARTVSAGHGGIITAADNATMVELYGCVRPLLGPIKERLGEHCFLKIKNIKTREIIDSASYGPGGGERRDLRELHDNFPCAYIGNISMIDWRNIKGYYTGCGDYKLLKNNCCTCATGAVRALGFEPPDIFFDANHGVGTRYQCAIQ